MAIRAVAFFVLATPDVFKIPLKVAQNNKIEQAISIQIDPGGAGGPTAARNTGLLGYLGESAIAIVVVKLVSAIGSHIQILVAIVIVVPDCYPHAVAGTLEPSSLGYVFKRAVGLLMEKSIPVLRTGFPRDAAFWSGISERSAVHQENVETSIIVVIEQRHACSHGFRQIVLGSVGGEVLEVQAKRCRSIGELAGQGLRLVGSPRSLPARQCEQKQQKKGKARREAH